MTDVTSEKKARSGRPTATAVARAQNPRGQGRRLREDLINAASNLLATAGDPDQVSMRAVARAAGVSPMAAYRHFADRDELLAAALDSCFMEFAKLFETTADIEDPFDRLGAVGRAYFEFANDENGHYRVLFSQPMPFDKSDFNILESHSGSAFVQLITLVQACLDANDDPRDATYVSYQVWTWVHGMVDLRITHAALAWPPAEQMLADLQTSLGLVRHS
jgi:AcrR family transcriptional regulator